VYFVNRTAVDDTVPSSNSRTKSRTYGAKRDDNPHHFVKHHVPGALIKHITFGFGISAHASG